MWDVPGLFEVARFDKSRCDKRRLLALGRLHPRWQVPGMNWEGVETEESLVL